MKKNIIYCDECKEDIGYGNDNDKIIDINVWLEVNKLGDEKQTFKDKNITIEELLEFDEDELKCVV